jgi:HlyD family secretion protein
LADQSDRVRAGQLLAVLDDGELRQQAEVAKADLAAMRASVERSQADIDRAQASTELARIEIERLQTLRPSGAVGQLELDQATERLDVTEAELRRARLAKIEAERQVGKAEESFCYYQERLADTRISAPFDGLIVRRDREPGDVVVPGVTILELISTEQLWVSAWVDETALGQLAPGQTARVVFRSDPAACYPGTIARLSPQADREMKEFVADVTVARLPGKWAVGQRAEVYIETARRDDVVVVPQRSLLWRDGLPWVIVNEGGRARWRKVTPGMRGGSDVEIVRGLEAGAVVVLVPPGKSPPREGRRVRTAPPGGGQDL